MTDQSDQPSTPRARGVSFHTTQWSVVLAAGGSHTENARLALSELYETYWYPLYAFVRRKGYGTHEAEELTQDFFARLMEKKYLTRVDRERGRFRSFLLVSLKHFLANEWDRANAKKRGGGRIIASLNVEKAESRYQLEPSHEVTPEMIFERSWALTLLNTVLEKLRAELKAAGREDLFDKCKEFLTGEQQTRSYRDVAEDLEMSEGALKVAVHRLRRRYREMLREEIAETVGDGEDVDSEIRHMISVIRDGR